MSAEAPDDRLPHHMRALDAYLASQTAISEQRFSVLARVARIASTHPELTADDLQRIHVVVSAM